MTAHKHVYDLHPNPKFAADGLVACTVCGFAVPLRMLASRVNLESITARENATDAVKALLDDDSELPQAARKMWS